jgi:hypothetical protein
VTVDDAIKMCSITAIWPTYLDVPNEQPELDDKRIIIHGRGTFDAVGPMLALYTLFLHGDFVKVRDDLFVLVTNVHLNGKAGSTIGSGIWRDTEPIAEVVL